MIYKETCFYCGTPMVNGICPDCGYQYPFAFECQYLKGITCSVKRIPCRNAETYANCQIWQKMNMDI